MQLEDVTVNVVTGLERRRRQLGSNSATVAAEDVNKAQISDFSDFLIGRAEGVIMNSLDKLIKRINKVLGKPGKSED